MINSSEISAYIKSGKILEKPQLSSDKMYVIYRSLVATYIHMYRYTINMEIWAGLTFMVSTPWSFHVNAFALPWPEVLIVELNYSSIIKESTYILELRSVGRHSNLGGTEA